MIVLITVRATGAAVDKGELVRQDDRGVIIRSEWYPQRDGHIHVQGYSLEDFAWEQAS
jgi:hypothetical protein